MSSAIEKAGPPRDLGATMQYAKALATATTLPRAYRDKPGDVLLAMEYGRALDLPSVATVMTSVHVIDGRPSMSAELMQALVRRAGHRIRITGDSQSASCAITRKDDPDFTYTVTFTLEDARLAKLVPAKADSGWAKYPRAMLKARAISECCREACADVLAGVSYVPEELGAQDWGPERVTVDALRQPDADIPLETGTPPVQTTQLDDPPVTVAEEQQEQWREGWQANFTVALEAKDLAEVLRLGQLAVGAAQADLADDARAAWTELQEELANA